MYEKLGYLVYRATGMFGNIAVRERMGKIYLEHVDPSLGYYWYCTYDPITDDYAIEVYIGKEKKEANNEFIY